MALPHLSRDHNHESEIDRSALITRYVETTPTYPTADRARLGDYGVSVTAIITQLQLDHWNVKEVARVYQIPVEAVQAAIAYYERHKAVIDARITLNAAGFSAEGRMHEPESVISFRTVLEEEARIAQERKAEDDTFINCHIETAPAYPTPDEARLVESGVSVTAIITHLQGALWNIESAAEAFDVSPEAVRAAIVYYDRHRPVIDARITLNSAWFTR